MVQFNRLPLLPLLLASSVLLNVYFLFFQPAKNTSVVREVIDGDTMILETGQRIRLLGVDAPEIDRCFGKEAAQALTTLVLEKPVRIAEGKPDAYGRTMALVYLDKTLINTQVIRLGFAKPDYTTNTERDAFKTAYQEAKDNNLGIHDVCKERSLTPPDPACVIKGNIDPATSQKFYHVPRCSHYSQVVLDLNTQEQYFCTEAQAIAAGFRKAAGCP